MKRWIMPIVVVGLAFVGLASAADPEPKAAAAAPSGAEPKSEADKTFYTLGLFLASRMQLPNFNMTPAELAMVQAGLTDGALNHPPKVDMQTYLPKLKEIADQRVSASKATTAAAEKKKGKEFLESIAAKPGIRKTGTGLLMETISEGKGTGPGPSDTVKVNYKGTTIDGHPFDSGEITRALTGVIPCWTEAMQFMKPGGKAKLYCPSDIAYGDAGRGADIPPGATLIFEVELVEVVK